MYGGRNKPSGYCKIATYLEHNASTLYYNIYDLCLLGALNARGNNGVTFLLPDKSTQKKINDLVSSNASKAISMLNACILPVNLEEIKDFGDGKKDIPNKLGFKLPIKSATKSSVTLTNGSVITECKSFDNLYSNNINIFNISGEAPVGKVPSDNVGNMKKNRKNNKSAPSSMGKNINYTGGNNSEFAMEFVDGENVDYVWRAMFDKSKSQIKRRVNIIFGNGVSNSAIDPESTYSTIDPLSHGLIACMKWLKENKKTMHSLISKTLPASPLAYWFVGAMMSPEDNKKWTRSDIKYDKKQTLKESYTTKPEDTRSIDAYKKTKKIDTKSITSEVKAVYDFAYDEMLSSEEKKCATDVWGSGDNFKAWWMSMCEFCYLNTVDYMGAYRSGNMKDINRICHLYNNYICTPCIDKKGHDNWDKTLKLCLGDEIKHKEHFCTLFTFYYSHMCCALGCELKESVNMENVEYKWDEKPNSPKTWSFTHLVVDFWDKCTMLNGFND